MAEKYAEKSYCQRVATSTIYRGRLPTRKRSSPSIFKDTSLPTIAAKTKHSKEAVDRYIRDYESVKVVRTATADIDKISHITRLSKRVISQYLDLIPQHQLQAIDENLANASANDETTEQGEPQ